MPAVPMTVVETEEFLRKAKPLMSDDERAFLVAYLGGARVIYYFHNNQVPLLSPYGISEEREGKPEQG
jgi:hypothetical protein